MSIFKTAYDTIVCSGIVMRKITDPIEEAVVTGGLRPSEEDSSVMYVEGGNAMADAIPPFSHPVMIQVQRDQKPIIVTDMRFFGKWDGNNERYVLQRDREHLLAQYRAKMTRIWVNESPSIIANLGPIPLNVYASWLSEMIRAKFTLEPNEQMQLSILAAFFYQCLFVEKGTDFDQEEYTRQASIIARSTGMSIEHVLATIENIPVLDGLEDFCKHAYTVTKSIRLQNFNPGQLLTLVRTAWFGTKADEIVTAALEHPPTWVSILLMAYSDRSYKTTSIMRVAERNGARGAGENFRRQAMGILDPNNY